MNGQTDTPFQQAAHSAEGSLGRELWLFVRHNKKWWLLPILGLLLVFALLVLLTGSGAAPFIYTLF